MNKKTTRNIKIAIVILGIASIAIMVHQFIYWGTWFEIEQVLHHETISLVFVAIACTLIVILVIAKPRKKKK